MRTAPAVPPVFLCLLAFVLSLAACGGGSGDAAPEDVSQTGAAIATFPNDQAAYDYFVGKGLASFQAAGIVGNLDQESGASPDAVQAYGPGRGIAQWSAGGRWDTDGGDNVVAYANQHGASPLSLSLQLDFVWYELTTFAGYGLAELQQTTSVADATIAFETRFEGCGTCDQSTRIAYAERVLADFGGQPPPAATPVAPPAPRYVAMASSGSTSGYWIASSDGGVFAYGNARFAGSMGAKSLAAPIVGMAATHDGGGYWLVAADGGVFTFGDARFAGSTGGQHLDAPIVGMVGTRDDAGYWLVAADGGVFSFGTASFHGSMGGKPLNAPVVGMAATHDGAGYWLVAADGGIFSFGTAAFHGSTGSDHLNAPIVGMAATADDGGYWLVAADGGIFSFGGAGFHGSMGGKTLAGPVAGMAAAPDGAGYWLVGADGGVFTFGDAQFVGSRG